MGEVQTTTGPNISVFGSANRRLVKRFATLAACFVLAVALLLMVESNSVAAQTSETEIIPAVTCLAGNGRVDVNMVNDADIAAVYRVELGALSPRQVTIEGDDWGRIPFTGRPDGPIDLTIRRNGAVIHTAELIIACDTSPPIVRSPAVQIINTCRGGNGYVLFQLTNNTPESRPWIIEFEGVRNRSTTTAAFGAAVRGVTGRPDGSYAAVLRSGGERFERTITVDCDPDDSAQASVVQGPIQTDGDEHTFDLLLDSGGVDIEAIRAVATYDSADQSANCSTNSFGSCGTNNGQVRVAVASFSGISDSSVLATVTVVANNPAAAQLDFDVELVKTVDPNFRTSTITGRQGNAATLETIRGDANCDGSMNIIDSLFIVQWDVFVRTDAGGCPLSDSRTELYVAAGDVNEDGFTDVIDALFISQCEVGVWNRGCSDSERPSTVVAEPGPGAFHDAVAIWWPPATDYFGIDKYEISVDGTVVATVPGSLTGYVVDGLSPGSTYSIHVEAIDPAGNRSYYVPIGFTTSLVVPTPPVDAVVQSIGGTFVELAWDRPETDANVVGYDIYVNGTVVGALNSPAETTYRLEGLTPDTSYVVGVYAARLGNFDLPEQTDLDITTHKGQTPPVQPAITVMETTRSSLTVRWGYSDNGLPIPPDDTGISHYLVSVNGQILPDPAGPNDRSFTATGLFANRDYDLQVIAIDEDGNSTASPTVTGRTEPPPPPPSIEPIPQADTTAPIWGGDRFPQIQSVDVVEPGAVSVRWCCALDFEQYNVIPASFDVFTKRASQSSSAYALEANVLANQTGGELTLRGLTEGTEYSVLIVAIDRAGNRSVGLERDNVVPLGAPVLNEPEPIDGSQVQDPAPSTPPVQPVDTYTAPEPEPTLETVPSADIESDPALSWTCLQTTFEFHSTPGSIEIEWSGDLGGHASWWVTARFPGDLSAVTGPVVTTGEPRALLTGLGAGTRYVVDVSALDAAGKLIGRCSYFNARTADPPSNVPTEPNDPCFRVVGAVTDRVTMEWDPVFSADRYDVYVIPNQNVRYPSDPGSGILSQFRLSVTDPRVSFSIDPRYDHTVTIVPDDGSPLVDLACTGQLGSVARSNCLDVPTQVQPQSGTSAWIGVDATGCERGRGSGRAEVPAGCMFGTAPPVELEFDVVFRRDPSTEWGFRVDSLYVTNRGDTTVTGLSINGFSIVGISFPLLPGRSLEMEPRILGIRIPFHEYSAGQAIPLEFSSTDDGGQFCGSAYLLQIFES